MDQFVIENMDMPYPIENGQDGILADAGSALANILGFTDELFHGYIEVCQDRKTDREIIYLHYINSRKPRQGNVKNLIRIWLDAGFRVRIIRPEPEMQNIIIPMGFEIFWENKNGTVPRGIPVDVWKIPSKEVMK